MLVSTSHRIPFKKPNLNPVYLDSLASAHSFCSMIRASHWSSESYQFDSFLGFGNFLSSQEGFGYWKQKPMPKDVCAQQTCSMTHNRAQFSLEKITLDFLLATVQR